MDILPSSLKNNSVGSGRYRRNLSRPLQVRTHLIWASVIALLTAGLSLAAASSLRNVFGNYTTVVRFALLIATLCVVFGPIVKGIGPARAAKYLWEKQDIVASRVQADQARHYFLRTIGFSGFLLFVYALVIFVRAGDGAVQKTFLQWDLIELSYVDIIKALWINVVIAVVAQIMSMIFGLVLAIGRLLPGRSLGPIRALAVAYVDVFRALPAIIVIYLICFGLPLTGIPYLSQASPIVYAVAALTITFSAYNAELFRSGIEAVHESQVSAALSLGMTPFSVMRKVVLPQAFRNITAPLLSYFIALQKDTALVNVVGIIDVFTQAKIFASAYFNLSTISVVCFLFIVLTIPQTRLVDALLARRDKRFSKSSGAK